MLILLITLSSCGMEKPHPNLFTKIKLLWHRLFHKPTPCYLAQMPADVTNLIASYLTFTDRETDEEFITRSKKLSPLITSSRVTREKINYFNMLLRLKEKPNPQSIFFRDYLVKIKNKYTREERGCFEYTTYPNFGYFSFCPSANNRRLIGIHHPHIQTFIFAIDVIENRLIFEQEYTSPFDRNIFTPIIAIAEKNPSFAFIENEGKNPCLNIRDMCTDDYYKIAELDSFKHISSIAFNKQETKMIVYGTQRTKEHGEKYDIFEIEDSGTHKELSKKTLKDYFKQKGICKNWSQSPVIF